MPNKRNLIFLCGEEPCENSAEHDAHISIVRPHGQWGCQVIHEEMIHQMVYIVLALQRNLTIARMLKMPVRKPLQGKWIIDLFCYFSSEKGREIISNGWKATFTKEAVLSDTSGLEPSDQFSFTDLLSVE